MKLFSPLFLFLFLTILLRAQQGPAGPKTYAVVVGISKYENGIKQLDFAHKDAQVFADYLKSKAGGSVPEDNIRLLVNENATFAAIYDALNWLLETCRENDIVYFYFSGHGDMENNTIYKLGFLLSYNTPRINYINNAVRIEDLNNIANTLSAKNKAKVILITDACHSGDLAGKNFKGTFLVGDQLRAVLSNEVRITSCGPDQLSNEDEGWGGGRGVFSYYLINGLKGLADYGHDGVVTVNEIKKYLDTSLANDRLLAEKEHKQNPVIKSVDNLRLASVDNATLASLKNGNSGIIAGQSAGTFLKPLAMQPQAYLFSLIGMNNIEELVDFNKLNKLSKEEIPFAFINMLKDTIQKISNRQPPDSPKVNIDHEKIVLLEKTLRENKDALGRFNNKLVVMLSDRGQDIINLYLSGDEAELERRRYYNSKSSGYDVYPKMFSIALKLTSPDNHLYRILNIKLHYFAGVAARLKMPLVEDPRTLLDTAMMEQKQAFALEENAAYIQNELGILYLYKKDYTVAEKYFLRATQITPTWVIPWANLCGLYAQMKSFDKGINAGHVADSLQPDLQNTNVNLGAANEISGNLLFAEEFYRKSIDINSRHYLPFERLGFVYMNTTQYAQADSFFYEAEKRKKGYHFSGNEWVKIPATMVAAAVSEVRCSVDTTVLKKDDIMAFFTWGLQTYQDKDYKNAVRIFKKVIALDKENPLVFHYMGKIFYDQQKWEEAELMFKYAIDYYLGEEDFNRYCDSVIKKTKYPYPHDCFESFFKGSHYDNIEDYFFIATVYESWSHFEEAETYFRKSIELRPQWIDGYAKLWMMLEKLGRFTETEKVIQSYSLIDKERSERELNEFYRRVIKLFPNNGDWYHRLGLLLYSRAEQHPRGDYFDTIIHFPVINKELFIDFDIYNRFQTDPTLFIGDKNSQTSPQSIDLINLRERPAGVQIPGTKESISLANAIYTPRKDGIEFLVKAADLITEKETVADINFKIGNIFVWSGSKKQAYAYYDKSIQLIPENAAARLRIIDVCKATYKNRAALKHLDYLYDSAKINFPNRMLLAEFSIHAGQFAKAKKILGEAESIHPYIVPEIADLNGRLQLLSNQPQQAIPFYQAYLNSIKEDKYFTQYTIARLYAQMKNTKEAWKWLKLAMDNGFGYYWVLKYDSVWNNYRNLPQWKQLTGQIPVPPL